MENPTYVAISRQMALQRQMDVVANNIANMNTPAFKAQKVLFSEYLVGQGQVSGEADSAPLSMVSDTGTARDTAVGPITQTGNPLDIALEGDGYFSVQTPDGVRYTRAGHFRLDETRQIVDSSGYPVLDTGGQPITIPENTVEITITDNGSVYADANQVGALGVSTFPNDQALLEEGASLYSSEVAGTQATDVKVRQRALEGSNVQPITEMTKMIEIHRQYQSVQKILESENDRQRNAITKLAKVSS